MVYDVAPEAEYFLATGVYFNDLSRVVDWFNSNDVDVVVASLSTLFEGPGNGTSPYTNRFIAAINRGVSLGMTFAISAGTKTTGHGSEGSSTATTTVSSTGLTATNATGSISLPDAATRSDSAGTEPGEEPPRTWTSI